MLRIKKESKADRKFRPQTESLEARINLGFDSGGFDSGGTSDLSTDFGSSDLGTSDLSTDLGTNDTSDLASLGPHVILDQPTIEMPSADGSGDSSFSTGLTATHDSLDGAAVDQVLADDATSSAADG